MNLDGRKRLIPVVRTHRANGRAHSKRSFRITGAPPLGKEPAECWYCNAFVWIQSRSSCRGRHSKRRQDDCRFFHW